MYHSHYTQTKSLEWSARFKKAYTYSFFAFALACHPGIGTAAPAPSFFPAFDSTQDVQKIVRFLTSDIADKGITYMGTAGELNGKRLPLSYYCTSDYWEKYVLAPSEKGAAPTFTDLYVPGSPVLTPVEGPSGQLQVERINVHTGCNIYDAATWQIALALAGHEGIKGASGEDLFALADNQSTLLKLGYDGNDPGVHVEGANRGLSGDPEEPQFSYNDCIVNNTSQAYFFRQIPRMYVIEDPVKSPKFVQIQDADGKPLNLPDKTCYPKICITWCDWKPITGENVWAFLIGPLQAALIRYQSQPCVPFNSVAVQNALAILPTFQKMQSKIGAIYYAPAGSLQNSSDNPVSPYAVSVENNMSALAGLLVFKKVLQQESDSFYISIGNKNRIKQALAVIDTMLYGGKHFIDDNGVQKTEETEGLLAFLKEKAWDKKTQEFILGGEANSPGQEDWVVSKETQKSEDPNRPPSRAVDVNTWGVAVLGQPFIDHAYGFGSCYRLWQNVKSWGGYYGANHELWGVGYSDLDGNGENGIASNDASGVLSGEWTAGAINMLRALITQYNKVAISVTESKEHRNQASAFVRDLQQDHDSMVNHIQSLRTDRYPTEKTFDAVRPPNYQALVFIPTDKMGYLYASKRYLIPFGWYANPIPSMASTTWAMMLHYNFNPFSVDGSYSANEF